MVQVLGLGKSLNVETVLPSAVEKELEDPFKNTEANYLDLASFRLTGRPNIKLQFE